MAVGKRSWGKASVNCCLRGNNSKWGKFREKDAAVLQLLIDPSQDDGFKLRELVLELSFTEGDPRLETTSCSSGSVSPSLVILEPPSPKYLKGKAATQHLSHEVTAQPQVGAGGISVGGVGMRATRDRDIERSWRFHSHWDPNELGLYTNAQWTWKAVAENPDIEDVGALYAGVIIQHPGQPFYLTCKVNGKLVNFGKKFRYGNEEESPCFTLIHPKPSQESIQKEAEELEKEIIDLIARAAASKSSQIFINPSQTWGSSV